MKSKRFRMWFWVIFVIIGGNLSSAYGDMADQIKKFHPYLTLQGLYDSNINLSKDNAQSDFITTILPGIKYLTEDPTYKLDLDFRLGAYLYAQNSANNYIGYRGSLDTFYSFNPNWTIKLLDGLDRSRNQVTIYSLSTPTGNVPTTNYNVGGGLYIRNLFQPELEYKFARDSLVSVSYRNLIYREDGNSISDSTDNTISPRFDYWFDIHNGISFDYNYVKADFGGSPSTGQSADWTGNSMAGRYLYRFTPRTTATGEFRVLFIDFEPPGRDYSVMAPSIYLDHQFSPSLSGRARFGWFWQQYSENSSSKVNGNTFPNVTGNPFSDVSGPIINLEIIQKGQRFGYGLSVGSGYRFDYFTASNNGFAKYYQTTGYVTYQLMQRLSVGLTGAASRDEYQQPRADTQDNYRITGNISYQPLKWMIVTLEAGNYSQNSDIPEAGFRDNKVMLMVTGTY